MENNSRIVEALEVTYQEFEINWCNIPVTIRHCPSWLSDSVGLTVQHIVVQSANRVPLPITNTGYRSHFLNGEEALMEYNNDPVAFVTAWLESAAKEKQWLDQQQMSLF